MSTSSTSSLVKIVRSKDVQKRKYAYHAHDYREVLTVVGSAKTGLTMKEVLDRKKTNPINEFTQAKKQTLLGRIASQLKSPIAFVLVLALILTLVLGEYLDSAVISLALFVAILVGVIQEGKASRAFEKLSKSQVSVATVIRDGKKHLIPSREIVIGDIVVLSAGVRVPADIRLVHSKKLHINESTLTGEWIAVKKSTDAVAVGISFAEQSSMAWMGTFVSEGFGIGVVVATGDQTAVGQIAESMRDVEEVDTPLQSEIKKISNVMLYVVAGLVLFIFTIGIIQSESVHDMLIMAIAIAVAAIPEGLPAAVTIILAIGMDALLKKGGLVRNLLAAETLGSTTYVLTDKTGTLTQAKMSVTGLFVEDGAFVPDEDFKEHDIVHELFNTALTATDAYTDDRGHKAYVRGDDVEKAILQSALLVGITENKNSLRSNRVDYMAFTSENRFAAGLAEDKEFFRLCVNGSPELLIHKSSKILRTSGEEVLYDEVKTQLIKIMTKYTQEGKRLIAVGYKKVEYDNIPEDEPRLLDELVLAGILVMDDPIRADVPKAIKGVQSAGVRVVLVTGDNPHTALSIAQEVFIAGVDDIALTGDDISKLSDEELLIALQSVSVFARVLPKQKLRIAMILQQSGEVVAMTGDGINDAPALRRANIGIAIGSGTEVAKEASDLILVKNSFGVVYFAIEEGRRIVSNLRKIIAYLLSTSLTEVSLISVAMITSAAIPILPAQILWANMIEEGLMSVAFAFEKGDKKAMKRKPRDIHEEGLFSREMLWFMAFVVTVLNIITVALYLYVKHLGISIEHLRSVMFLAISLDSLFIAFAFRSLSTPIWKIPIHTNVFFIGSFVISLIMLTVVLTIPFFQNLLSYTPLPWDLIILPIIAGVISVIIVETGKVLFFPDKNV